MPVRTYPQAHGRNAQPPYAVNAHAAREVPVGGYRGDVGGVSQSPQFGHHEVDSRTSHNANDRRGSHAAPALPSDPRRHSESARTARWTPPQSSAGSTRALPPIQQSRRVEDNGDEVWAAGDRSGEGRSTQRGGGHAAEDRAEDRGSVVLEELSDLEHRVRVTEATSRSLLKQALVASAEIDRAWQMLTVQGDQRAASESQKRLLKDHIRNITQVVHNITTEIDQVSVVLWNGERVPFHALCQREYWLNTLHTLAWVT